MSHTARIEKNRLALLAILAPWFAFAFLHCGRSEKPLPRRVAAFALEIISKVERAAGYLLIASAYAAIPLPRHASGLRSRAVCLAKLGTRSTRGGVPVTALYRRLAAVWRVLTKLQLIARNLIGYGLPRADTQWLETAVSRWSAIGARSAIITPKPP